MRGFSHGPGRALDPDMATNWNYDDSAAPPVEQTVSSIERRRRLKPIVAAIVLVASFALALLIAHFWAGSAPYPYAL